MNVYFHKSAKAIGAALASIVLTGCANHAVVFSTATRTGVEISAAEGGQQGVHVGFERFEGVTMPSVHPDAHGNTIPLKQAYPVYAEYEFQSGGLTVDGAAKSDKGMIIRQAFATGHAATHPGAQRFIRDNFKALGGKLMDEQTLNYGNKLTDLLNNLAPGSDLAKKAINAINSRLPSGNPAANLDQATLKVQRAANQGRTGDLAQILEDLNL